MISLMSKSNATEMEVENQHQLYQTRQLQDKVAVIFGASEAIGSQVACEFSKEGATVFLSGRHLLSVKSLVKEIRTFQGKAQAAEVDALNETAVNAYLDNIVKQTGKVDIVFNAMGLQSDEYNNGKPPSR